MKKLNELLGTRLPIIQGGMANIATGEFAAACSNAGARALWHQAACVPRKSCASRSPGAAR